MPSNINPYNVDGTFPIAGQDNSSQGFRDNFTNIRNNLVYAEAEISDLQAKALVISPLNSQAFSNDMAGTKITRPQLAAWTQSLVDQGVITSGTATLDYNIGNFQKITTNQATILTFSNWPTSIGSNALGFASMRVWIAVSDASHTVTLPATVVTGVGEVAGLNTSTGVITFDAAGNYIFEFSSIDGGTTYIINDITRNRLTFRDNSFYYNPSIESSFFMGFGSGLTAARAIEQGTNRLVVGGSVDSLATGNLGLATVNTRNMDTGSTAGFAISGARGNLVGNTYSAVRSNDFLGSFAGEAFTGFQNIGNVFQQISSIGFYATGANVTWGLGGNIAFFTARDNDVNTNTVHQAMGIENDQTVNVTGAFKTSNVTVDTGTIVVWSTGSPTTFTANNSVGGIIVDNTLSSSISNLNVRLPQNPVNGQQFSIAVVPPVVTANVYADAVTQVKSVAPGVFNTGNVHIRLAYYSDYQRWYRVQ